MSPAIAIVGMACLYPDARSPIELWENVLAQRRAFRRMPTERLSLEDYWSDNRNLSDYTYGTEAALIEGYEFDRVGFRVTGNAFRSADFAHWLALDIATQALQDAGFPEGEDLPNERTGVLLGNTLTGEFSRTNTLRLRWPYVRRVLEAALIEESDCFPEQRSAFFKKLEAAYKAPFPTVGEETLAGNLSNTIAGRICNHYDLKGGGYTIDGACSSSLLAVAQACTALTVGDLDVALAGGVDLSLDPFELVGFAKAGALANSEMRVYDARAAGFWPGEGCGFVVLMRQEDALAQQRPIYAVIRGWGISSDGNGGITRPDVEGQLLAIRRAYERAGFGAETVSYFEGHGTGTSVGDATELQVLSRARREKKNVSQPAAIGSIKANIGHTKAAAGLAGLIKAVMALRNQVLPTTTGCEQPHPQLLADNPALRVLKKVEPWPEDTPLRAGVSAMGFGGINAHVVLENPTFKRRQELTSHELKLSSSSQDCELFLLSAETTEDLTTQIVHLLTLAPRLSRSELTDLAAELEQSLNSHPIRAAIVAATPKELASNLETLRFWLENGIKSQMNIQEGIFLEVGTTSPKIGFLFPGQASPSYLDAGVWGRRFSSIRDLYDWANLPKDGDRKSTDIAQPAIMTSSMVGLRVLDQLGIVADVGVGHSLGELAALHWAGVWDEATLLRIATARGQAMARLGSATGAMASIQAEYSEVKALINGDRVVVAGLNSPRQTILSGEAADIARVVGRAQSRGLKAVTLPVSHAFHSPLVAAAVQPLAEYLEREQFQELQRSLVSTVSGTILSAQDDLRSLLCRQVTEPVRFMEAIEQAAQNVDLFIEVGPGGVLGRLAQDCVEVPVVSLDAGGASLRGLLNAVGAAYAVGAPVHHNALFSDRFTRPFSLDWQPRFFVNPCELAPQLSRGVDRNSASVFEPDDLSNLAQRADESNGGDSLEIEGEPIISVSLPESASPVEIVRHLVVAKTELPLAAVQDNHRLLSDLHLNSITVSQIVVDASRKLGLAPPVAPTHYADATVTEIAKALKELIELGGAANSEVEIDPPSGVDAWVRPFTVKLVERSLPQRQISIGSRGAWRVITTPDHPLAATLQEAFQHCEGHGVVVCLPAALELGTTSPEELLPHIELLLEGSRAVLSDREQARFVLVQQGEGGAAFARTLYLEAPQVTTCIIDVPMNHPQAVEWILAEARSAVGYSEAHYDASGTRREAVLRLLPLQEELAQSALGPDDVLLVTGGGKGIAAECTLSIAKETGVRLALLGRSNPEADAELATNLDRMAAVGVQVQYVAADVTDAVAVRDAVQKVQDSLGPITAILHGAGMNVPQLLSALEPEDFLKTLAPKVQGIRNVLAVVDQDQLRFFVTFGSIIARTGLPGEADYALANEWLGQLVEHFQTEHPDCRCLNVEWSIWSGVGMGARLGRVDVLMQQGITPITPEIGITMLRRLMATPLPIPSVVVTGRFGNPPTLKLEQPELPFLRFLEQPRTYYPGVELIVDAELSTETDLYLNDHIYEGERIFPGVMGLEAMAQVAMALLETSEIPVLEGVQFHHPVVVAEASPLKIRLAALVRESGKVEVVLRSEQTGFAVEHFRATLSPASSKQQVTQNPIPNPTSQSGQLPHTTGIYAQQNGKPNLLDPKQSLYGNLLFHHGHFQRLREYRYLRSTECIAEIEIDRISPWFSRYLPPELVLGDPGARDAVIHALQACVPHATLLPVGGERLTIFRLATSETCLVVAKERQRTGDTFIYDLQVLTPDGEILEQWEGLTLQIVKLRDIRQAWDASLLAPYLERQIQEFIPTADVTISIDHDGTVERRVRSDRAILAGQSARLTRRPDGKPELTNGKGVSVAHAGDLTLVVTGAGSLGADVEPLVSRSVAVWRDLLGGERFALAEAITAQTQEDLDTAATRVWTASECLKKAGATVNTPLTLFKVADREVWLASGEMAIGTFAVCVDQAENQLNFAVLTKPKNFSGRKSVQSQTN